MSLVALIPARGGSQRIPRKNIKPLGGKPLLCWTIEAAQASGIFAEIVVSTDDPEIGAVADRAGARVSLRPACLARNDAPDIGWVRAVLDPKRWDAYAILRPTSPFRTADTIRRAWQTFQQQQPCDALRAVEPAKLHPGKMWLRRTSLIPAAQSGNPMMGSALSRERLVPILPWSRAWSPGPGMGTHEVPWHSCPTQTLPEVYVQNASLEIAWSYTALPPSLTVAGTYMNDGTLTGEAVTPFLTYGWEGFDINTPDDWDRAEAHAATLSTLAPVPDTPAAV